MVLTVWVGFWAIMFGYIIQSFASFFSKFGASLPSLTQVVLNNSTLIWAVLLLSFLLQLVLFILLWLLRSFALLRCVQVMSGLNIAAQLVLFMAMYLPIFEMRAPL